MRRRTWLVMAAAAGTAALWLGLYAQRRRTRLPPLQKHAAPPGALHLGALLALGADGVATVQCPQAELGQGIKTALPRVVADELDLPWAQVRVELLARDFTGASQSVARQLGPMRQLGATARAMLLQAAAQAWGVPVAQCHTAQGQVLHAASGRALGYGALAGAAAALPVPDPVPLKAPADFRLIGHDAQDVDLPAMLTGALVYGSDFTLPGMLHAVFEACPEAGGTLASANLAAARAMPGVRDVFELAGTGNAYTQRPGVAVVAHSFWAAQQARLRLAPQWQGGPGAQDSLVGWRQAAQTLLTTGDPAAQPLWERGNVVSALAGAAQRVEAVYEHGFVAHAAMEPLSCTAHWQDGRMSLWAASQNPGAARQAVAQALGLAEQAVHLHPLRCGGAFGRRLASDHIVTAAVLAQRVAAPVKLAWTREDDMAQDHLRPPGWHRLQAGLGGHGELLAWQHHLVGLGRPGDPTRPAPGGSLEGHEFPAPWLDHARVLRSLLPAHVTTGLWRAPSHSTAAWVAQSFVDELAHAAGQDPLAYRLRLLGSGDTLRPGRPWQRLPVVRLDRLRAVLQAAAQQAAWGQPLPPRHGRGIACHHCHGGYVAQVVQMQVLADGRFEVQRVVSVCDVGEHIVNPVAARAQVEGSILDALAAAWLQQVDVQQGRVMARNFDTYPMLRLAQAPRQVDVHFLRSPFPTTGLGEPALPPLAPALCNALFAATGQRLRRLPLGASNGIRM